MRLASQWPGAGQRGAASREPTVEPRVGTLGRICLLHFFGGWRMAGGGGVVSVVFFFFFAGEGGSMVFFVFNKLTFFSRCYAFRTVCFWVFGDFSLGRVVFKARFFSLRGGFGETHSYGGGEHAVGDSGMLELKW